MQVARPRRRTFVYDGQARICATHVRPMLLCIIVCAIRTIVTDNALGLPAERLLENSPEPSCKWS